MAKSAPAELKIQETEEPESEEQDVIGFKISYYPADLTLKGYVDKDAAGQLLIPEFQRSYVWDQVRASKLIESFLLGIPVPGVFLYKERQSNKLQIIDGQQRILSAIRYFTGRFEDKVFKLKKVHPRWEGKSYSELDESDRFQLDDAVLRATVIQQLDTGDDSSIYHVFERLNTGGVNLTPMEIRKCVYHGAFYIALEDLNTLDSWRTLLGSPTPDRRLRDLELLLRVLALSDDLESYEKPMKSFLNNYMVRFKHLKEDQRTSAIADLKVRFKNVCDGLVAHLPPKPFHLRGRLNYAVMDSTMSTLIHGNVTPKKSIKAQYQKMLADKEFIESASISTSDEKVLRSRFEIAGRCLRG